MSISSISNSQSQHLNFLHAVGDVSGEIMQIFSKILPNNVENFKVNDKGEFELTLKEKVKKDGVSNKIKFSLICEKVIKGSLNQTDHSVKINHGCIRGAYTAGIVTVEPSLREVKVSKGKVEGSKSFHATARVGGEGLFGMNKTIEMDAMEAMMEASTIEWSKK